MAGFAKSSKIVLSDYSKNSNILQLEKNERDSLNSAKDRHEEKS